MVKLIVALLLSVGLANGLANYGGCTCEVDDYKERFETLENQVGEMLSLLEFIASKATASPTVAPPELNGRGKPCVDVVTVPPNPGAIVSGTCYVVDGTVNAAPEIPADIDCVKVTVPEGSGINGIIAHLPRPSYMPRAPRNAETRRAQVRGDSTEVVVRGKLGGLAGPGGIAARPPRPTSVFALSAGPNHYVASQVLDTADGTKITNTGTRDDGSPVLISARALRPSARSSEGPRRRLLTRRCSIREPTSR